MIPHHGSKYNFHESLAERFSEATWFVTANSDYGKGKVFPYPEVTKYLSQREMITLTENVEDLEIIAYGVHPLAKASEKERG